MADPEVPGRPCPGKESPAQREESTDLDRPPRSPAAPRAGMTLIEVVAAAGVFTVLILSAMAAVTGLSRFQQLSYQRSLAANMAMVIAEYRATDMMRRALANYSLGPSAVDTADPAFPTTLQYGFWNSLDYRNPGATWHGYALSSGTPARQQLTTAAPVGTTWVDQCPLFDTFTNWNYYLVGSVMNHPGFSVKDTGLFCQVQTSLTCAGGLPGDQMFFRLYRLSPGLNAEDYRDIFVAFSQPSEPPAGAKIKGHFVMASFWSLPGEQVNEVIQDVWNGNNGLTVRFLGRYAILDSLEP